MEKEIRRKLDEPFEIGFEEGVALQDALGALQSLSGVNFVLNSEGLAAAESTRVPSQSKSTARSGRGGMSRIMLPVRPGVHPSGFATGRCPPLLAARAGEALQIGSSCVLETFGAGPWPRGPSPGRPCPPAGAPRPEGCLAALLCPWFRQP